MQQFAHAAPFVPGSTLDGIGVRAVTLPQDWAFLQALFMSTRTEEIAASGWPQAEQHQFLAQQFTLQHHYYRAHLSEANFWVLLRHAEPVGRLYWHSMGDQARLMDISLCPAERGQGLGTAVMRLLAAHADACGQTITLHIDPHNPARRLYARHGFEAMADNGVYAQMQRLPRNGANLHT